MDKQSNQFLTSIRRHQDATNFGFTRKSVGVANVGEDWGCPVPPAIEVRQLVARLPACEQVRQPPA